MNRVIQSSPLAPVHIVDIGISPTHMLFLLKGWPATGKTMETFETHNLSLAH